MKKSILIIGETGSGKSTSIRTLNPDETYIINVIGKNLPFKGSNKKYVVKQGGNMFISDNSNKICQCVKYISENREDIKNIIIDDFQYVMSNEFMRRVQTDKKMNEIYERYNEIAASSFNIIQAVKNVRDDIFTFILTHSEKTDDGFTKLKTLGKLTDRAVTPEGHFDIVLQTLAKDGSYYFKTNTDGDSTCKSPFGMFEDKLVPNDLNYVIEKFNEFYN